MKNTTLTFLFLGIALQLWAQIARQKKSLYFPTDQHELSGQHRGQMDSLWAAVMAQGGELKRINITGSTDSDADSLYNRRLSERRAASIKAWFAPLGLPEGLFHLSFLGEERPIAPNDSEPNKERNRRADVELIYLLKKVPEPSPTKADPAPIPPAVAQGNKKSGCGDTLIILPQGTRLTLDLCDYREMKGGLEVGEYLSPEAIRHSGFTTMTTSGDALASYGMWCFGFGGLQKLRKKMTVRVPVTCFDGQRPNLFTLAGNGRWGGAQRRAVKIVTIRGQQFFEFKVDRPLCLNLDKKIRARKWSFIAEDSLRLLSVKVSFDCPAGVYSATAKKGKPSKHLQLKSRCLADGASVSIEAVGKDGQRLFMDYRPLDNLSGFEIRKGCPGEKWLGVVPLQRKKTRSLNYVRLEDFER